MATSNSLSTYLGLTGATGLKVLRDRAVAQLYSGGGGRTPGPMTRLANTFTRYASTQATAYDRGTVAASPGGTSVMERQVERALAQVLGGAPGGSPDSFMGALAAAFPIGSDGRVQTSPSRSMVSPYSTIGNGNTPDLAGATAAGLAGQISVEQANLYRQATVVADDALKVLASLQPFVPIAETDRVEALRAMVNAEIRALVDEFGRLDEPRPERVEAYFLELIGPNSHLRRFGDATYLRRGTSAPASIADEAQIAGFELLQGYVSTIRSIWSEYFNLRKNQVRRTTMPLFTERLSRASIMLPVLAEGNANLMSAMDSIGFTENERRAESTLFTKLDPSNTPPQLPNMTVNDLNEWLGRFSGSDGPSALTDSGQYGLDFVTDQANNLFWVIVPILTHIKNLGTVDVNSMPIVAQALIHERVSWALDDVFTQLKALADLAVAA